MRNSLGNDNAEASRRGSEAVMKEDESKTLRAIPGRQTDYALQDFDDLKSNSLSLLLTTELLMIGFMNASLVPPISSNIVNRSTD